MADIDAGMSCTDAAREYGLTVPHIYRLYRAHTGRSVTHEAREEDTRRAAEMIRKARRMIRRSGSINVGYLARHYAVSRERVRRTLAQDGLSQWRTDRRGRRRDATIAKRNAKIAALIRSGAREEDAMARFQLARGTVRNILCHLGASARTVRKEREAAREARRARHRASATTASRDERGAA